jgi:hypothetical protein
MHTRNNRVRNILVASLLVITTSISVGFYFARPQTAALANNEPVQQMSKEKPAQAVIEQNTSQEAQLKAQEAILKTQNDITVEITSAKVINTGVEIGICYTTPDNGEWYPMPGHLFYDKYEVYPDEYEFLEGEILADGKNTGTRCALIRYRIDDLKTFTTPIEFSILKFYAPGREMYTPCQELQQRLDSNPKAKAYGLKAKCVENSDGTISATLLDHAKSVSNDNAKQALDKIAKAEVVGPWEFTIAEIEK